MTFMSALFKQKNPLSKLSENDFKMMFAKLEHQKNLFERELRSVDKEIMKNTQTAKTAESEMDRDFATRRLNSNYAQKKSVLDNLQKIENEHRAVSNLLIIKEHERLLKKDGVWSRLSKIDPEKLFSWLAESQINATNKEAIVQQIIQMTEDAMQNTTSAAPSTDKTLDEVLEAIGEVKVDEEEPASTDEEDSTPSETHKLELA